MDENEKYICIQAYWAGENGEILQNCQSLNAGKIEYFFSQNIQIGEEYKEVFMMKVQWFEEHPQKEQIMEPIEIWNNILHKPFGPASFMPVLRIHQLCVACPLKLLTQEPVLVINPIRRKLCFKL